TNDPNLATARGGVNARHLTVASEIGKRNPERHEVEVEASLGILAGTAQLQQVEDRLDVGIKTVVALPRERDVARAEIDDPLLRVTIELGKGADAVLRGIVAVVALVVE